jgi:ArsR family transcriptional regulator
MMTQISKSRMPTPKDAVSGLKEFNAVLDAGFFKALSDPTRLRLLGCLTGCARPCSLGEIAECCSIDLSVVSRHMSQLADAGIVLTEKRGRSVMFTTNFQFVADSFHRMAGLFEGGVPDSSGGCCE